MAVTETLEAEFYFEHWLHFGYLQDAFVMELQARLADI